jgi:ribosome biogenesis GTPase
VAKRRLNKQQKTRIEHKHAAMNNRSGESCHDTASNKIADNRKEVKNSLADTDLGEQQAGLVVSHFRAKADIECPLSGDVVRCNLRANLHQVVTGDRVIWRRGLGEQLNTGIVEAINTRTSELRRPDSYGKMKLVGANITRAIIVIAPEPEAHSNLIDRYLVVAENLELEVLLLVNKADLLNHNNPTLDLLNKYQALGYKSLAVSSKKNIGMEELQRELGDGCSIFVGQSGVGKSSVIQALLPAEEIKIGDLSDVTRKGRHTTTHARLYHFPNGGDCIDSPGIREFGLWHLTANNILHGFTEFRPFIGKCKFRNCTHINDANCAIEKAVQDGAIKPERYQSFLYIIQSLNEVTIQTEKNFRS